MLKKLNSFIVLFLSLLSVKAQILITSPTMTYNQDFGVIDIVSWTDNSTFLGWYQSGTFQSHVNVTSASPSNNGGFYSYECNGDNDQKIGTRPSNGSGSLNYGMRFKNNTTSIINSLKLTYTWYQFSLAGNGNVINTNTVSYQVSSLPITSLTTGTWTDISTFTAPRDTSSTNSGAQHYGFPCTVTGLKEQCFFTTINPGDEIMVRWRDPNNTNNDPHLGIDNVIMSFGDIGCQALPILLIYFDAKEEEHCNKIQWGFDEVVGVVLESSYDGLIFNKIYQTLGNGVYEDYDYHKVTYYRLSYSGEHSKIIVVNRKDKNNKILKIYNLLGQEVKMDWPGIKFLFWDDEKVTIMY